MAAPQPVAILNKDAPNKLFVAGQPGLKIRFVEEAIRQSVPEDLVRDRDVKALLGLEGEARPTTELLNAYFVIKEAEDYNAFVGRVTSMFPVNGKLIIESASVGYSLVDWIMSAQINHIESSAGMTAPFSRLFLQSWFASQEGDLALILAAANSGTQIKYGPSEEAVVLPPMLLQMIASAEENIDNGVIVRANEATEYAGVNMVNVRAAVAAVLLTPAEEIDGHFTAALAVSASLVSNKPARFVKKCKESALLTNALVKISVIINDGNKDLGVTLSRVGRALPLMRLKAAEADARKDKPTHLQIIPGIPKWAEVLCYSGSAGVLTQADFATHVNLMAAISTCLGLLYAGNLKDAGTQATTAQPWTVHWNEVKEYNNMINSETIGVFKLPANEVGMNEAAAMNLVSAFAKLKGRVHYLFNNPYNSSALERYQSGSESIDTLRMSFDAKLKKALSKMK